MAGRGGFRGGYNPYSHNSGHGTPNSSYHGSPTGPAHSPFGANGRGWSNPQPYSPQQQYPPQYSQGGYAAPSGPQASYPSHSPPYPPTGPAAQFSQGPSYRGRGGPGAFRGNQFGPGRGGTHRGGFKNPQWTPGGPGAGRGQHAPSIGDAVDLSQPAPDRKGSSHSGGDANDPNSDNPFRPSKDLQVEDTSKPSSTTDEQMPPPNRAPPSGPSSASKFSFAFKASTKPVVAAPKPEVASKFNAVPPRQPQSQSHSQSQHSSDRDRDRRDLPRGVPTEPASSRSRRGDDRQHHQQQQPRAEPPPPRVRMVKKTMKRLKKKTPLDPELASSDSVYFRKPGDKSVIGSGTYGKVFKGLNVYTKKLVALKKIKMEGERDGFPVTAVREIKLLQSLKHLNIVNLQEVMVEKNDCFMVFEYMSHDLTGLLNHPSYKLNPAQKKDLAKQMFDGLDYLHKRGVLHRDIKAANILVSSDGILKLADFGLARFYAKRHQLDYTNRVITIWYRSPELLLGETQYGPAVDNWSAACVLVEIFTKHAIFPGNGTEVDQLEKIYAVLGTPNKQEWPNLPEMPWFELLRPNYRKASTFAEKYKERLTPAGYDLLCQLFRYDPAKRPTAAEVLEHAYFTSEEPAPKQAIELQNLDGDWHELESKALRRENERIQKEAKRQAAKDAAAAARDAPAPPPPEQQQQKDKDKEGSSRKRPSSENDPQREAKRLHVPSPTKSSDQK
ncbi:kinase-like domain-containing protein [Coniochaeta sp. 2T2.1]|nr:kinase-like domain-containing protein [Coniochaeta sp. 2T2.1]